MDAEDYPELPGKPFITPQELADALDASRRQVYRWLRSGKLHSVQAEKKGTHRIFPWRLGEFLGEEEAVDVTMAVRRMREKEMREAD